MPYETDRLSRLALAPLLLGCVLLAAGCTATTAPPLPAPTEPPPQVAPPPPPPPPAAPSAPAATAADIATRQVLAAHERIRALQPPELAKEQQRLGDGAASPQATVELALVLAQARRLEDSARAITLLDSLQRSSHPDAPAYQPVARLLSARIAEQRRLEETLERQAQQARDNQRKLDQANEKLEALKAIERSLVTRPGAASGPASGKANGKVEAARP